MHDGGCYIFFFKQKTAYEMRISDWSSDVCSSDLFDHRAIITAFVEQQPDHPSIRATNGGLSGGPREVFYLLQAALRAWVGGALDADTESWTAFRERARRAFADLAEPSAFHDVLVVSSGGVISQLAQHALGAADERALELTLQWRHRARCESTPLP